MNPVRQVCHRTTQQRGFCVKTSTALFMIGMIFTVAVPPASAGDEPLAPVLPERYDMMTLSRGPSKVIPGLELPGDMSRSETATILTIIPADGSGAGTRIEWSGRVTTSIVYKNTRNR